MPLTIGAAAAPIIGGIIGNISGSGDKQKAIAAAQNAYQQMQNMGYPPDLSKALVLQQFKQQGTYIPEMEQTITLGPSAMQGVQMDPTLQRAQMGALQALQARQTGGLTAEDRAAFAQLQQQAQTDAEAKRQQIIQNMQARGMGGQGAELAAQLQASQAGAQAENQAAMGLGAAASQNALQAALQSGQFGTQLQQQGLGLQEQKASAADEIARFNALQAIAQQQRNVGAQNVAQQQNLAQQQAIANANVEQANQEAARQAQAQQQYYNQLLARQGAVSQAGLGLAGVYAGQSEQAAKQGAGIGAGVGQMLGGIASSPTAMQNLGLAKPPAPDYKQQYEQNYYQNLINKKDYTQNPSGV